jgi:hypothetical protein
LLYLASWIFLLVVRPTILILRAFIAMLVWMKGCIGRAERSGAGRDERPVPAL